jgi:cysteine synthase
MDRDSVDEMAAHSSILEQIGRTPLVRLRRTIPRDDVELWAKLECLNPGGSAKDRAALAMVDAAEREGQLVAGGTIVEASAGNTGVALAMVAAARGYRCVIVVPEGTSAAKVGAMEAYGAEVRRVSCEGGEVGGCFASADAVAQELPGAVRLDQFDNPANAEAHFRGTGPEILDDLRAIGGRLDALVAATGTGGTFAGAGRFLRGHYPSLELVWVVPRACADGGSSRIEGLSEDGPPPEFAPPQPDEQVLVDDADAFATARELARREGLLVGPSSGAAVWGALRVCERARAGARIVVILPDTGRNYL